MSYLFTFSYCSWGSPGKNTEVVCHSLLQWTTFCQTSPPWPGHLGWPHTAWLSFLELDKLWSMWSDWLVVCDCGFSVSALWCPLSVPTILLGFLLPCTRGLSSWFLQQSAAAAPYLECGVAPLGHHPWPWTWGNSSWLLPLTLDVGYLLSAAPVLCSRPSCIFMFPYVQKMYPLVGHCLVMYSWGINMFLISPNSKTLFLKVF